MGKKQRTITVYTSAENADKIDEMVEEELKRKGVSYKKKELSEEEIEERKRKTEEDYNRIVENLNRKYKNPERAISRKHSGKKKFGDDIVKRLNTRKHGKDKR